MTFDRDAGGNSSKNDKKQIGERSIDDMCKCLGKTSKNS